MLMLTEVPASTREVWVHVTDADIAAGCRGSVDGCMIALALCRAFDAKAAMVIGLSANPRAHVVGVPGTLHLPYTAGRQAKRFDDGLHVNPFSFSVVVSA